MRIAPLRPVTPKGLNNRKPKDQAKIDDKKFLEFLRGLPCCVCGKPPRNQSAHVRLGGRGGMGIKPLFSAVPLCYLCHHIQSTQSHEAIATRDWWLDQADKYLAEWRKG